MVSVLTFAMDVRLYIIDYLIKLFCEIFNAVLKINAHYCSET